jgi:glutaconyl-CoA/methylmalonyl-CoA decarboxylase subunit gamma
MRFRLDVDGEQRDIEVEPVAGGFLVRIDGASYRARTRLAKGSVDVRIGPKTLRLHLQGNEAILDDGIHRVRLVEVMGEGADLIDSHPAGPGAVVDVRSSMPGRVVRVAVAPGSPVRRGETLVVLEAMKMQNEIPAPADGVVRRVPVSEGETVTADRVVASIELRPPSVS